MTASFLTAAIACAALGQIDELALLREDVAGKNSPIALEVYPIATSGLDVLKPQTKGDSKIGKALGKKVVRFAFGADWNGDGNDEVVIATERTTEPNRPLEVKIFKAPQSLTGDLGKPLASFKKGALAMAGSNRVVAMAAIDLDGDKKDEIAVVRAPGFGEERLEIFKLPTGAGKGLGQVVASDWTFGGVNEDNYALFAGDADADGKEDLAALRHVTGGQDSLLIFRPPTIPIGESQGPILSDPTIDAADGADILAAMPIQRTGPVSFQLVLLRKAVDGTTRLDLHSLPNGVNGDIGVPVATEGPLDGESVGDPIYGALAIRHNQSLPWIDFEGPLNAYYHIAYPILDSGGDCCVITSSWVGPFTGFVGDGDPTFGLKVTLPGGQQISGTVSGAWTPGNTVSFPIGTGVAWFFVTAPSGIVKVDDAILVTYPTSVIEQIGTKRRLKCTNPGGPINGVPIGEVQIPSQPFPDNLRASVMEYYFVKP